MQVTFGAGLVFGSVLNASPEELAFFGVTQEWSIDIDQKLVNLMGQYKDPVDVAPGERTTTGKIKFARVQASIIGNFLLGIVPTSGSGFTIFGPENHSSIGATTFVVTNGATFLQDLGLYYHSTGIALQPTTAAPSAGWYIPGVAATGVYTIAAGDESVAGGLDAFYQASTTTQFEITVGQQLMGTGPAVSLYMNVPYAVQGVAKQLNFQMYAARLGKVSMAFKNNGYMVPEVDFTLYSGANGNLFSWASSE